MHKTSDISKFDIHWQVKRVSLKKLNLKEKLEAVSEYFYVTMNRADRERVLNYLEGLSMAYQGAERELCLQKKHDLSREKVNDINSCSHNFIVYDEKTLKGVTKDLMIRATKWLSKGYRNEELLSFIIKLCKYRHDEKTLQSLEEKIEASKQIKNTHKFFF